MTDYYFLGIRTAGFLLATFGGASFVRLVLRPFAGAADELGGIEEAGKLIGIFERAIVVILVFEGAYSALGLIIAAKSIARFNRLKERETAEYYLVGTLASVSFAIAAGVLTNFLVTHLGKLA